MGELPFANLSQRSSPGSIRGEPSSLGSPGYEAPPPVIPKVNRSHLDLLRFGRPTICAPRHPCHTSHSQAHQGAEGVQRGRTFPGYARTLRRKVSHPQLQEHRPTIGGEGLILLVSTLANARSLELFRHFVTGYQEGPCTDLGRWMRPLWKSEEIITVVEKNEGKVGNWEGEGWGRE